MRTFAQKKNQPQDEKLKAGLIRRATPRSGHGIQHTSCACGGGCPKCQMKKSDAGGNVSLHEQASPTPLTIPQLFQSSGQALDASARRELEPRFGADFSAVRVHTGAAAAESAAGLGARAYTVGPHIVFGAGQYQPRSPEGHKLLAHELAHVVQQQAATSVQLSGYTAEDEPYEREADRASADATSGRHAKVNLRAPLGGAQFGLYSAVKCSYYMWKYSKLQEECRAEYKSACGGDMLSDECADFMGGTGFPSDAIMRCIGRKNPTAKRNLLESCLKTATGSYGNSKWTSNDSGGDSSEPTAVASSGSGEPSEDSMA